MAQMVRSGQCGWYLKRSSHFYNGSSNLTLLYMVGTATETLSHKLSRARCRYGSKVAAKVVKVFTSYYFYSERSSLLPAV